MRALVANPLLICLLKSESSLLLSCKTRLVGNFFPCDPNFGIDDYFSNVESSVFLIASAMTYGATPYFFEEPNINYASNFVWANIKATFTGNSSSVWILNAMAGPTRHIGYGVNNTSLETNLFKGTRTGERQTRGHGLGIGII